MDTTLTYRGYVRNGQIALDDAVRLPEGAQVSVQLLKNGNAQTIPQSRRQILRLPLEQRRQLLTRQSERAAEIYASDDLRTDWQAGDVLE